MKLPDLARPALAGSVAGAAGVGLLLGGPVAAVIATTYTGFAVRALIRRDRRRRAARRRRRELDDLAGLAADLRAGLPPPAEGLACPAPGDRLARLTAAVRSLAERTGAPAADLIERIEADARASDRAAARAAAQAAGAQATSTLLAILPVGGVGLGYAIGVDPLSVLLHTPVGMACALAALILQVAGLLWSERLVPR